MEHVPMKTSKSKLILTGSSYVRTFVVKTATNVAIFVLKYGQNVFVVILLLLMVVPRTITAAYHRGTIVPMMG